VAPGLAEGTYDVVVTATNGPYTATDVTADELTIDTTAPVVTVEPLTTDDTTPELTGTVSNAAATVQVTVAGNTYAAGNNGDGTWTLADDTIAPPLSYTDYDVAVSAMDIAGNVGTDATADELSICRFVTLGGGGGVRRVRYTDPDGSIVTIVLRGLAAGEVRLGFQSASPIEVEGLAATAHVAAADGVLLRTLQIVEDSGAVRIAVRGGATRGTTLAGVTGDATLNRLIGRKVDLIGEVNMPAGIIRATVLRNVRADVTMGGTAARPVLFRVLRQADGADVAMPNSSVRALVVGSMIDSSFHVGVAAEADANLDGVADLPAVADLDAGRRINRVRIRGYGRAAGDLFGNSNIAADSIGWVRLKNAALANGGAAFGLSSNRLRALRLRQAERLYRYLAKWVPDPGDLTVRLV